MDQFEVTRKCQGEMHRAVVFIKDGEISVSCPDHDFDLDELQEALDAAPKERNFCLGLLSCWTGMRDVTLDQVKVCVENARSHGLTSKTAREMFGNQVAELMYLGIRSPTFAGRLLESRMWPTRVPFNPVSAEIFVKNHPDLATKDFSSTAMAGGIGMNEEDLNWLKKNRVTLRAAVQKLYEPKMWSVSSNENWREESIQWWKRVREILPTASGGLVLNLASAFPLTLSGIDELSLDEVESLTFLPRALGIPLLQRLIMDCGIRDAPTLLAIYEAEWSPQFIAGLPMTEIKRLANNL